MEISEEERLAKVARITRVPSLALYQVLLEWKNPTTWLTQQSKMRMGLCSFAFDCRTKYTTSYAEAASELEVIFLIEFGNSTFPFSSKEEYLRSSKCLTQHFNPVRKAFVDKLIENYEKAKENHNAN